MNYIKVYNNLIKKGKFRKLDKFKLNFYMEKYYIILFCIGGNDDFDNLVLLIVREYFIVYWFLVKIYYNLFGLIYVWWLFYNFGEDFLGRNLKLILRGYQLVREKFLKIYFNIMKEMWKFNEYREKCLIILSFFEIRVKILEFQLEV